MLTNSKNDQLYTFKYKHNNDNFPVKRFPW